MVITGGCPSCGGQALMSGYYAHLQGCGHHGRPSDWQGTWYPASGSLNYCGIHHRWFTPDQCCQECERELLELREKGGT